MDAIDEHLMEPDDLPPVTGATMVVVTNRNAFIIRDRFDGVPYTFKPNETLSIPPDVAAHFFGWPGDREDMNIHIAKRRGWNTKEYIQRADPMDPNSELLYERYANNIVITVKEYVLVPKNELAADDGLLIEEDEDRGPASAADPTMSRGGIRTGSKAKRRGRRSAQAPVPTDPPIPSIIREE